MRSYKKNKIIFTIIIGFQSMPSLIVFLTLALVCYNFEFSVSKKHYISPKDYDHSRPCEDGHQCFTLSEFADKYPARHLDSSVNLVLFPGVHYLTSELRILSNIRKFEISSYSNASTMIICDGSSRFTWTGIHHVLISGITFRGCGLNQVDSVEHFEMVNSTLKFIESTDGHKILFVIHSNVTITNSIFSVDGNTQAPNALFEAWHSSTQASVGGAIAVTNKSNVVIRESRFEGNGAHFESTVSSGAIIHADINSTVTMNNTTFSNNRAANSNINGMVFLHNSTLITHKCVYRNNFAREGGAIYAYKSTLVITESTFSGNAALKKGGTLMLKRSIANIHDSVFMHNTAFNGGGIYSGQYSTVKIHRGNFTFNEAINDAGAILGDQSILTLAQVTFSDNRAKWAGAVALYEKTNVLLKECKLSHNRAKWGGALALHKGTMTLMNSVADYQHSTEQGGVVYVNGGILMVENSSISNNEADRDGGAIVGVDAKLIINGSNFTNNHAKYYGSIIFWSRGTITIFGDFIVESNTAENGLIYLYDGSAYFTGNISFIDNQALLYIVSSHIAFSGRTTFPMLEINSGEVEKKKKADSEGKV